MGHTTRHTALGRKVAVRPTPKPVVYAPLQGVTSGPFAGLLAEEQLAQQREQPPDLNCPKANPALMEAANFQAPKKTKFPKSTGVRDDSGVDIKMTTEVEADVHDDVRDVISVDAWVSDFTGGSIDVSFAPGESGEAEDIGEILQLP